MLRAEWTAVRCREWAGRPSCLRKAKGSGERHSQATNEGRTVLPTTQIDHCQKRGAGSITHHSPEEIRHTKPINNLWSAAEADQSSGRHTETGPRKESHTIKTNSSTLDSLTRTIQPTSKNSRESKAPSIWLAEMSMVLNKATTLLAQWRTQVQSPLTFLLEMQLPTQLCSQATTTSTMPQWAT